MATLVLIVGSHILLMPGMTLRDCRYWAQHMTPYYDSAFCSEGDMA